MPDDPSLPSAADPEDRLNELQELARRQGLQRAAKDSVPAHQLHRISWTRKLAHAQDIAEDVPATGQADPKIGGWSYASTDDVVRSLTPCLQDAGLAFAWEVAEYDLEAVPVGSGDGWLTRATLLFYLIDVETGYRESFQVPGLSINKDERGLLHASQQALRSWLMTTLQVTADTGDGASRRQVSSRRSSGPPPRQKKKREHPYIDEAQGINWTKVEGQWKRGDIGELMPACSECGSPAMPIPPDADPTRWLCVRKDCGEYWREDGSQGNVREERQEEREKAGDADARGAFNHAVTRANLLPYEVDALIRATPDVPERKQERTREDYEKLTRLLKTGQATEKAMRKMAEHEPTGDDRVAILRGLIDEQVEGMTQRARVESAIHTEWAGAVEWWIDELSMKEVDI